MMRSVLSFQGNPCYTSLMGRKWRFSGLGLLLAACCVLSVLTDRVRAQDFEVFASNNPPFNYQLEDGEVGGIAVDILKAVMERAYMPISQEQISIINWARAVEYTWTQPYKILLSPARTPKREDMFAWLGPLHSFQLGLIARKDANIRIKNPEDLGKYRIGVVRDSAPAHILEDRFNIPSSDMTQLPTGEQLFLMLERERVDMVPRSRMSASFWLEKFKLNPADYEMVYVLKELDLYIAFSPMTDPDLIHRLNLELVRLKADRPDGTSEYEEILRRHVHGMPVALQ